MTIKVGDKLPAVSLRRLGEGGIDEVSTEALTQGKKVVMFAVPGAFTPTCSDRHLPGFLQHADAIKARGVDAIICVAVNDPFVVSAWREAVGVDDQVELLSDGNGELTRAIGLELDASGIGLGTRSQRYAMIIDDGVVETLLIDAVPTQTETSSANEILARL